ncbi:hypothetical protein RJ639_012455 [Escallonia herrerae]|uniref:C2 domain-containing protein n=1 Tax=Escallonia herrerae TaxID=1293975 RepID=A0AA89AQJ9_9ASTE|nr:hypothetical protein RJ639_012455 [Escallonia herrerae]
MDITEASVIHHVGIVLLLLWLLSSFNCCHPVAYFISLIYLGVVHQRYLMRLRRNIQFEERRQAYQRRVLSDSETVRWLNHAVEKIWPVCMEQIVSQKILLPIIPWFLQKYKPWTVKDAVVQHLYMGRSPPMFTEMRVLHQSTGDDHLIFELGMNFRTADDMSAILAVKLRKRLGFGMWAKLHLMGMHVEGKREKTVTVARMDRKYNSADDNMRDRGRKVHSVEPVREVLAETPHMVLAVDVYNDKIKHLLEPAVVALWASRLQFHCMNIKNDSRLEGLIKMEDLGVWGGREWWVKGEALASFISPGALSARVYSSTEVLVGVKFLRRWPFLGRLRVCFAEPPYFQMTVKPLIAHGLDVTELPGIAGWLDNLLAVAFEQTLVEPNMLVVDVEKFASPQPGESWFTVDAKEPIAYAIVEVIEAADMKPADLNGFADPYVKGQLGPYRFRTKTQKKTLSPKWQEEFKIPIATWESPNVLAIEARDKDRFVDDTLGSVSLVPSLPSYDRDCSISINDLRDGQRHDMWLSLEKIKMGRLHLAITVVEGNEKGADQQCDREALNNEYKDDSFVNDTAHTDKYEPINIEGQRETGIWVHRPGADVPQVWESRKGKSKVRDSQILQVGGDPLGSFKSSVSGSYRNDSSSTDESLEGNKTHQRNAVQRGLQKFGSVFHRSPRKEDKSSPKEEAVPLAHDNLKAVNAKEIGVTFIVEDNLAAPSSVKAPNEEGRESPEGSDLESPGKGHVREMAKSIFKKSARGIKHALSRKGSRKFREPESIQTERDIDGESDSSGEESLPASAYSPQGEGNLIPSIPITGHGSESFKSEENIGQPIPSGPGLNIVDHAGKVKVGGSERTGDEPSGSSETAGVELVEEGTNSKVAERSLGVDT